MADLLAIISPDRTRTVSVDDLTATYEALRGPAASADTATCGWAAVRVLDHPQPPLAGIERGERGWAAWAGALVDPAVAASGPLERLDGQFALLRLEEDGETLRLATDPLGMKPLFVVEAGGLTHVSTSALVLAKHLGSAASRRGAEAFLRTGIQFGRATPWEGVERLLPAEAIAFTPAGQARDVYWRPAVDPEVRELDLAAGAELVAERLAAAIASRYGGRQPWLDLTGGFDSRLVALLSQRAELGFHANTIGDEGLEDVRVAAQVAAAAGWPWTRIGLPGDWTEVAPTRVEEALAWGDGNLEALHLTEVIQGHREKAASEPMLLTGGGGEHYRDFAWMHELWRAKRSTKVDFRRLLAWRAMGPLDVSALRRDPTAAAEAQLLPELEQQAAPFSSQPTTFQCDVLYAFKSSGHFGAYQSSAGRWVQMEMPLYLKPGLLGAISTAPGERGFHRLMREMMRYLDPRIAAMQTETGGPAEPLRLTNALRFTPYVSRRARRLAARLRGRAGGPAGDPAAPDQRLRGRAAIIVSLRDQGRLDPAKMRSAALYEPERLGTLLDLAASEPGAVDWALVGRIVTLELALEAVGTGMD
ncbi:MAG TPA: hypothetical protein VMS11_10730 [Solirubrobacterales bacterium]|nr:hypothetical protein [Solirubrobacterales bacterium]